VTFGAVLDANVLVPVALADTLLGAAEAGLYRPLWSGRILAEVRAAILRVHPELDPSRIDARLHAMNVAFEDALVEDWEPLVDGIVLGDDPDGWHVVALAEDPGPESLTPSRVPALRGSRRPCGRLPAEMPGSMVSGLLAAR